ncbi:ATP-dependent helicase [Euzebya tangerina]|uniref:ATP-dependent helicase n=1 Tax=Euzebya tangerina TaxID=591198 RepID=UPI0013C2CC5B|nr:ATP-dependent DNA helicase UvrD2 [Euzebya tangerina]
MSAHPSTAVSPTVPDHLLAQLNPEQAQAAALPTGPVRILAGAGTGKTRTITHRIAGQIASGAFEASQILAVTFTERAAAEMRTRILHLLATDTPERPPSVRALTFHAAAWAQVRHFWPDLVAAEVVTPPDHGGLPEVLTSKLPLLGPIARRIGVDAADLAAEVEWAASADLDPAAVAAGDRDEVLPPDTLASVIESYTAEKARRGAIDYEDMLRLARRLTELPDPAATIRERYRAFTVDEFQDTNTLQWRLLRAWVGDRDDVCVVGDPAQTIFSFTGANAEFLRRFHRHFPGTQTVGLDRSYRSTPQILELSNRVLGRRAPDLRPTISDDGAPRPLIAEHADEDAEIAAVVSAITTLAESGVPYHEMAICYRINAQAAGWEDALRKAGVPVTVRGEGSFYDRQEVRRAIRALTQAVTQPQPESAPPIADGPVVNPNVTAEVERVFAQALSWRPGVPPSGRRQRDRWEAIEAVRDEAGDLADRGADLPTIAAELSGRVAAGVDHTANAVTLMSLHRAKGTEFDAVFIVAAEEGLLPISYAETDEEVDEERRLLYVGVTRARRWLSITWAGSRPSRSGRQTTRRPSRFLYGLGEGAPSPGQRRGKPDSGRRSTRGSLDDLPDGADPVLAEKLRGWRLERSRTDDVPAFVVFNDATLIELATHRPIDRRALLRIRGIGPAKADRYGAELLAVIAGRS